MSGAVPGVGRVAGAASLIAVLTVASRLVGFGRTAVFGWTVQGTALGDVYQAVNTVPNVIFELVAGGALASVVVPLLAGPAERGDRAAVSTTASALLTWTLSLLLPLAVLVAVFAGPIVALLAADATAAELAAGTRMLRVFAPQLPLYGVGIVLTGVLQAHRRFAWPVLAPLLSSVVVIGTYLTFAAVAGPGADLVAAGRTGELILAVGTTVGVAVLGLCLVAPARRLRLRWRPGYGLAGDARRAVRGLAAAGLATVAGQQVALLVALNRGWAGPAGTVVQYALGQAVYLLPWAVLAVPLAVAAYPTLAAAWTERDDNRYAATLAPAARGVLLLSCLGAAGLVAVAGPAAHVLLDPPGTAPLAAAIVGFAPGLVGYALFALLSRALYARGAAAPAAVATLAGWAVAAVAAVGFAAALPPADRAFALALGNSVGMLVLGAALVAVVARRTRSAAPGPTRSAAPSGSGALAGSGAPSGSAAPSGSGALAGLGRVGAVGALAGVLAAAAGLAVSAAMSAGPFPDLWAALSTGGTTGPSGATMDPAGGTPGALAAAAQGMLSGGVSVAVFIGVAYPLDRHDLRPLLAGLGRRLRPAGRRR